MSFIACFNAMPEELQMNVRGDEALPTLIYLPGLHGDWTLIQRFQRELGGAVRFVEFTYPRNTCWSLEDYARAIEGKLAGAGITNGWLLAESFGSQVAWAMIGRSHQEAGGHVEAMASVPVAEEGRLRTPFLPDGLILAGGFVKYPRTWQVRFAGWFFRAVGPDRLRRFLAVYARYARIAYRNDAECMRWVQEFIERRTDEDFKAMLHRLELIRNNDPGTIAGQACIPVHHVFGLVDPVVPGFATRRWLRRHCPGYRSSRMIPFADHNVLDRAATQSGRFVLQWTSQGKQRAGKWSGR